MIRVVMNRCFSLVVVALVVMAATVGCGEPEDGAPVIKGFEWRLQNGGTEANLRGVCAVSREIAWFSGSDGTVGKTVDGGANWESFRVPGAEEVDFRDIEAFDDMVAVIMGVASPAMFYKTVDGGESWKLVYKNNAEEVFFNSMGFWDRKNGIAVSDPVGGRFLLVRTADGGDTWKEIAPRHSPVPVPGEAQFAASGTCLRTRGDSDVWFVTGGAAARLFYSKDRGEGWDVFDAPIIEGASSEGIFSVAFRDGLCGIVTGGDYKKVDQPLDVAAMTHDGGKTWTRAGEGQIGGLRECAVFFDGPYRDCLLAIGPSGADFSVNCGVDWTATPVKDIHSISAVPGETSGWGVGAAGKIVHFRAMF